MGSYTQKGQALLIIVLVMVVALTTGLAVVGRSITNLRISNEEESSQRAFSAAEAGVEQALRTTNTGSIISDQSIQTTPLTQIKSVTVTAVGGNGVGKYLLHNGALIDKDDGVDVWFSNHNADGSPDFSTSKSGVTNLRVYWGTIDNCLGSVKPAAIEVIVVTGSLSLVPVQTKRYVYDPCSRGNSFTTPTSGSYAVFPGKTLAYKATIVAPPAQIDNLLLVRVIPLYSSDYIGVSTCDDSNNCTDLALQGKIIESVGKSDQTVRKIQVFQGYTKIPSEIFQYGAFIPN